MPKTSGLIVEWFEYMYRDSAVDPWKQYFVALRQACNEYVCRRSIPFTLQYYKARKSNCFSIDAQR